MAKAKKSKIKKLKSKKPKPKKAAARASAKKSVKKKVKKVSPAPKKKSKKAAPKKKQKLVGEGDYKASRKFLKDQADFVKRNKDKIPAMGKEAENALDGPEGESLRAAEQEAMNRSTID